MTSTVTFHEEDIQRELAKRRALPRDQVLLMVDHFLEELRVECLYTNIDGLTTKQAQRFVYLLALEKYIKETR